MNMNSTTKQRCGEKLDQWGIHAQCCACGPGRNGRHNTFAWQLAEIAKDAGFTTTREVDVPQWAQWKTRKGEKVLERAILDVVCEGHLQLKERFLDMSVRCPLATTYMPAAAEASGVAAEEGARSKTERYPPTRGLEVVPCIMETYGRINVDFNEFLMQAATHAERKRSTAGLPAQRFRARWEADFSRLLARLNATSILSACRCSFAADTPDSSGSSGSQAAKMCLYRCCAAIQKGQASCTWHDARRLQLSAGRRRCRAHPIAWSPLRRDPYFGCSPSRCREASLRPCRARRQPYLCSQCSCRCPHAGGVVRRAAPLWAGRMPTRFRNRHVAR